MTRLFALVLSVGLSAALIGACGSPAGEAQTADAPSFDCAAADGEVETLICDDAELAALDRRLADVWEQALAAWPEDEATTQRALQRGWIGGRNECWKETDVRACVVSSYQTRLVEVQIQSGQVMAASPVSWTCTGDDNTPVTTAFYSAMDPRAAVITVGGDQVIAIAAEAATGARYVAPNVEFWEHQGEANLEWFGTTLTCTRMAAH